MRRGRSIGRGGLGGLGALAVGAALLVCAAASAQQPPLPDPATTPPAPVATPPSSGDPATRGPSSGTPTPAPVALPPGAGPQTTPPSTTPPTSGSPPTTPPPVTPPTSQAPASAPLAAATGAQPAVAAAPSSEEAFERGNQAYLHGDYRAAIDAYEQVLAAGVVHEDLYYALGNAYFKADRLGPAILDFERALALDPSQDDARANLALARQTAAQRWQDKLLGGESDPLWMRALGSFTPGGVTLVFLGLYAALFLLVLGIYFLPTGSVRVGAVALLVFVIAGTVASGGLLAGRWWLANRGEEGIVLPDELAVKEGPDPGYQTSFLVHGGLRVRAVAHDQDWIRIRLGNGLEGWIRDPDLGRL